MCRNLSVAASFNFLLLLALLGDDPRLNDEPPVFDDTDDDWDYEFQTDPALETMYPNGV